MEKIKEQLGPIILGANDAIVELTGALAGLALTLENKLVALIGLVIGISASISMGLASYLHAREQNKDALKAGIATAFSYFFTSIFLTWPFWIIEEKWAIGIMVLNAFIVILAYVIIKCYLKGGKELWKEFLTILGLTIVSALVSYLISSWAKTQLGIEI